MSPTSTFPAAAPSRAEYEEVRDTAARAIGASLLASATDLLTGLVSDPSTQVRSAVRDALMYRHDFSQSALDLALRACLPSDVDGLTHILWRVDHSDASPPLVVRAAQAAVIRKVVLNVAVQDRVDGDGDDLRTVFGFTRDIDPRLPIDFARVRIEHQLADQHPRDLSTLMRLDSLPDDIREAVRDASTEDDLGVVLDQIEKH